MRESTVEAYLVKRVKETGGEIRKVKWLGRRGAPDRVVGYPFQILKKGLAKDFAHCFVELKKPGKGLEKHQTREIKRLYDIGFNIWVIDSKDLVDRFINFLTGK